MSAVRSLPVLRPVIPFTGSSAGRASLCAASCVLPQARTTNDAADDGTQLHAYLAVVSLSPASKTDALKALSLHLRERARAIDVAAILDGYEVQGVEMAYALDVDTGAARYLGMHRGRDEVYAGLGDRELGLTLDVVARKGGRPVAKDWKTGRTDYGPAEEGWQLKVAALALRSIFSADEVEVSFDYIEPDGGHRAVAATFGPWDLDQALEELRAVVERVDAAMNTPPEALDTFEGSHCDYCPAFDACPSKHRLARVMASPMATEQFPGDDEIRALAPEVQGRLWARVESFLAVAERVKGVLKETARRERLPLPNGKVLGAVEVKGRVSFDKDAAVALLERLGASEEDIAGCVKRGAGHVQIRELKS